MTLILVLFLAGVILLALEVVVPGAILGIIGGVLMLIGVVVAFDRYGSSGGALATAAGLGLGGITLYLEFVLLPKSRLAKAFSMTATVAGTSQPAVADRSLIGKRAVAVTTLAPSGVVECDGRRYEAFARSGLVAAGAAVDVIDLDTFRVIVTLTSKPNSTS
jgi:membrane-bound serine protease (ClpP class)